MGRVQRYLREVLREPALVMWAIWLALIPFYVLRSGLPQLSNAFIFVLLPVALNGWDGRLSKNALNCIRPLLLLTAWIIVVNLAWAVLLWAWDIDLIFSFYYVYNAIVFLVGLIMYRRFGDLMITVTVHVLFVMVLFLVAASVVFPDNHRSSLFFSNSNQLGYYALLSACVIALAQRRVKFSVTFAAVALAGCGYLALISASRAATAGIAIMGILLLAANPRVIIVGSLAITLAVVVGPVAERFEKFEQRLEAKKAQVELQGTNFFEERHYDRIWKFKQHLVFGAGEGNVERFTELGYGEIHSSFGTVLFSYGILGISLLISFMWNVVRRAPLRMALLLIPPLAYTAAHNGLRFTMLWLLFVMLVNLKESEAKAASPRESMAT